VKKGYDQITSIISDCCFFKDIHADSDNEISVKWIEYQLNRYPSIFQH